MDPQQRAQQAALVDKINGELTEVRQRRNHIGEQLTVLQTRDRVEVRKSSNGWHDRLKDWEIRSSTSGGPSSSHATERPVADVTLWPQTGSVPTSSTVGGVYVPPAQSGLGPRQEIRNGLPSAANQTAVESGGIEKNEEARTTSVGANYSPGADEFAGFSTLIAEAKSRLLHYTNRTMISYEESNITRLQTELDAMQFRHLKAQTPSQRLLDAGLTSQDLARPSPAGNMNEVQAEESLIAASTIDKIRQAVDGIEVNGDGLQSIGQARSSSPLVTGIALDLANKLQQVTTPMSLSGIGPTPDERPSPTGLVDDTQIYRQVAEPAADRPNAGSFENESVDGGHPGPHSAKRETSPHEDYREAPQVMRQANTERRQSPEDDESETEWQSAQSNFDEASRSTISVASSADQAEDRHANGPVTSEPPSTSRTTPQAVHKPGVSLIPGLDTDTTSGARDNHRTSTQRKEDGRRRKKLAYDAQMRKEAQEAKNKQARLNEKEKKKKGNQNK